jgi:polyphenol oxidase
VPIDVTLEAESRDTLAVYPVTSMRPYGVDAFVTDRFGGVSDAPYDELNLGDHVGDDPRSVEENRRRVAHALGVESERLAVVRQVHGARLLDAASLTPTSEADGLFTDSNDHAIAVLVADCLPILLVDTASPRLAVVHAGWRGLRDGVIASALAHFANVATLRAFLGPSISVEGYQVGPDVAAHFADIPGALLPDGGDRSRLDLARVATEQLLAMGVSDRAIERTTQVTDGGEEFFSDRARRPCGRFALVAKRGPVA